MAAVAYRELWQSLRRKSRISPLVGCSILLMIIGAAIFVFGSAFHWDWIQPVGGIVFGAGLAVLTSAISSRVAVREQYAKEANLKRKDNYYGPLHADLKALRDRLEAARNGVVSYPLWIAGAHQKESTIRRVADNPPTLAKWSEFRVDYRIDNFTQVARELLNGVIDRADEYNAAIDSARAPTGATLEAALAEAVQSVAQSVDFREWQLRRAEQMKASRIDPDDEAKWYQSLVEGLGPDLNPTVAQSLAAGWVDGWALQRPETLGWLLASRPDHAARCLDGPVYVQGSRPAPPPIDWRQNALESALAVLKSDPSFEQARCAGQTLFEAAAEAEKHLAKGLLYIRDHYEGGRPPV